MTKAELRRQEIREELVQMLRRAREKAQQREQPARFAVISTFTLRHGLPARLKSSAATVRRHLRALEAQGTIRDAGFGLCAWQYIADEDRQREADDKARHAKVAQLEAALAERYALEPYVVTVFAHDEGMLHVDMTMAERLLRTSDNDGK